MFQQETSLRDKNYYKKIINKSVCRLIIPINALLRHWAATLDKSDHEWDKTVNKHRRQNINENHFLICHEPTGRLGNQMFNLASALGIASSLNYTFVIRHSHPFLRLFEINQIVVKREPENVLNVTIQHWRNDT